MKKIEFFRHGIGDEEIERVGGVLRSLFLTTGNEVAEFEETLAGYLGLPETVAVTSCTAAMQLALLAEGIGPGDEVITTPLTFIGSVNAILMTGATPVLADVDRSTGNIDPAAVAGAVTPRTRAILPVHLYGQMCDMEALRQIADSNGLFIVEDAAHTLEGEWNGKRPGHYGDYACFSFYATKNVTSGEGGAISLKDQGKCDLLKQLRLHGFDRNAMERYTDHFEQYDVRILGWKYNMDNIHAAILNEQMKKLSSMLKRRKEIYRIYLDAFSGIEGIELHDIRPEARHACHILTLLVDPEKRDTVMSEMQNRGIGMSINFHPVHLMTYYRERFGYKKGDFPAAEEIGSRTLTIPFYPKLTAEEIEYVIENLIDIVRSS
ncbi:MAG: DegT/DnrJ/EryC1/StrS family aminotransferase [Candidatus Krumholzibacteriota bacterium]|nr:DegT/DnrJ/EryC1/StrS family aminotransferase [Candidatus Krumholzibacteriota bacterium]